MIRTPAVAGSFYPDDPVELEEMVARCFSSGSGVSPRPVVALLAPHAGLVYSGRVAGATYARVLVPDRVLLIGPNHTGLGASLSVWDGGDWEMPGGVIKVDSELCASLRKQCPLLTPDRAAHFREHSLEVHLPFLKARQQQVRIAPVVVGTSRLEDLLRLGKAMAESIRRSPGPVLIVISSDMTHYESAAAAARKDRLALEEMKRVDPEGLHRVVRESGISMCGYAPAVAALFAARELGALSGTLILYSHSGEVSGDCDSVVGYAGMVFS
jgi:MEMO1 family protein